MKTSVLRLTTLILFSASILISCSKEDEKPKLPLVNIANEATVTSHSAVLSAVVDNNGSTVVSGGFYWSRKPNPTANDSVIQGILANNLLSASLDELPQGKSFYYAAYAQSAAGISVSAPKKFTLAQNAPQIDVYVNNSLVNDQLTLQIGQNAMFKVQCSMEVPAELVQLSRLRISYATFGSSGNITDQNVSGATTEYNTGITFSTTGEIDLIFELFDEYNNVTKKTLKVTVIQ